MDAREVQQALQRAKQAYDASGASNVVPIRISVPLPPPPSGTRTATDIPPERFDPDTVRRARENLWLRLPKVHRAPPAALEARVRDARLLASIAGWDFGSPCVLMCGPTESGKSSAAALAIIRTMVRGRESNHEAWKGVHWFGANELTTAAREWPLGSGDCPTIRKAASCRVLVLDDLGNEQEWQTTMFDLLQRRYERCLTNIVTTGLSPSALLLRYGDAIMRRLVQRNGETGTIVNCWGEP